MNLKLIGGNIVTMDALKPYAAALAVHGDVIELVGSDEEVVAADLGPCELLELRGMTVVPGFVDSHVHAFATGLMRIAVDLSDCDTVDGVCRAIARRARKVPANAWVYGLRCSPWALREKRFPTLGELDEVSADRPVYICSGTLHSSAANSAGLSLLERSRVPRARAAADPEECGWFLDDNSHFAAARVAFGALDDDLVTDLFCRVVQTAAARGVTTLHCLEGQMMESDRDVELLQAVAPQLPARIVLMYQTMDVERVLKMGLTRIGGCLTVDGACFEHTACFYEPYLDRPDTCGSLNYTEEEVQRFVREAHGAGLQIGMHAIGDRAIDVLVRAYADAAASCPQPDPRHRVEHFHTPSESAIELAAKLRLSLPMQPIFSYLWDRSDANHYVESFGTARAERMEPFARLCREGITVAGGSDSPVTDINPLLGIHSLVNNPRASRRTSVSTALSVFTRNGAWVAHDECEYGTIGAGRVADLAVLGADPFQQSSEILDIPVLMTISRGEVTHCVSDSW